jgi:signal transduction histidine kinase/CheY-like chemotaxis protein
MFQQAPGFIAVTRGPEHTFEMVNLAYQQLVGRQEIVGKTVSIALPEVVDQGFTVLLDDVYSSGKPFVGLNTRVELRRGPEAQPEERFLNFIYQPIVGDDGKVSGIFTQGHDVTEQTHADRALRALNATLEQRVLEEVYERSKAEDQLRQIQKMEAVGQLTGGIAHDFNNMLAVVIGSLNLLQRRVAKGDTNIQRFVDAALDGAQRAATLTQRLLAFSRQQPLSPEVLNANRLVAGMSEMLARTLGETIQVETVLSAGLWQVRADPVQLENALINLSVNARDAMLGGGKLTIETSNAFVDEAFAREFVLTPGQYVLIAVADTGTGMTPETMLKAFDPFYTTKGVGKGTGLGLSQVYGFVRQSGGHVKLYSEVDVGTSVKIYLPRHYGDVIEVERPKADLSLHRAQPSEVILVVEDDERVRAISSDALKELGYGVIVAASPRQALEMLRGSEPQVSMMFTDVVMPEMSGRELADLAREIQPGLKVLYTTGYTRNAIVHNGILDPGTSLLTKPFTIEELATKVRRMLDF